MTTTTTGALAALEDDQAEHARDLVNGALKRSGLTKAELRTAMPAGFGRALHYSDHPSTWASATAHDRAVVAAGRLLLRLRDELFLPMESMVGPSAISIATELLQ
jgi:hypothetical protein